MFPVPIAPTGSADFTGTLRVTFVSPADFAISAA